MLLMKIFSGSYPILRRLLSYFDAEKVHDLSIWFLKQSFFKIPATSIPQIKDSDPRPCKYFGLSFENPVGLAAGLDKNAEAILGFQQMGFSFIEVGTVTPKPQTGNPKPRLFRDFNREFIFNCMGFNNCGTEQMIRNMESSRPYWKDSLIVGVNIGKNSTTSLEDAHKDYRFCAKAMAPHAHYLCVNVSSPNTVGLRTLQNTEGLKKILGEVFEETHQQKKPTPVLVKLAPEIENQVFEELIVSLETWPIAGYVLTNTLQRPSAYKECKMSIGGLSGAPLREASLLALKKARTLTKKPIVSVGGILSAEDAQERIQYGADLVQIYSGLIFKGPKLVHQIRRHCYGRH